MNSEETYAALIIDMRIFMTLLEVSVSVTVLGLADRLLTCLAQVVALAISYKNGSKSIVW